MPTKTFRTIAKKCDVSVPELDKYWKNAEKSYDNQQAIAKRGGREPIKHKYSYMMATTLRQAQGRNPHIPLSRYDPKKHKRKAKKEGFNRRVDEILESTWLGR
jgi:hypothetical protein